MSMWEAPATDWAAVTPSDTVDLAVPCRALYVGTGGDVVAVARSGAAETFSNVQNGTKLYLAAKRVNATGTTASNIVALY